MATTIRRGVDGLVGLTDLELVCHIYALVPRIEDRALSDEFYFGLEEAFERFAPDVELAERELSCADDPNREAEMEGIAAGMARRAAKRDTKEALIGRMARRATARRIAQTGSAA